MTAARGDLLTFRLMQGWWGVDLLRAREVLRCSTVTHVPALPPWIRGVIGVRGDVVPVIDLGVKLLGADVCAVELSPLSCVVLVEASLGGPVVTLALLVDEIGGIEPAVELSRPPEFGVPVRLELLLGVTRSSTAERLILVLDLDRVLDEREVFAVESAAAASGEGP